MNCKHLAKIMPELVSGEIDKLTAREAEIHICSCRACALELEKYEKALGALECSQMDVDSPAALDTLQLPVDGPRHISIWRWIPAMGAAAAAIVLAFMLFWSNGPERVNKAHRLASAPPAKKSEFRLNAALHVPPTPKKIAHYAFSPKKKRRTHFRQRTPEINRHIAAVSPNPFQADEAQVAVEYVDKGYAQPIIEQNDHRAEVPPPSILSYRPYGPILATREQLPEDNERGIRFYYSTDADPSPN